MQKFLLITLLSLTVVACDKHDKQAKGTFPEQNDRLFPPFVDEDVDDDVYGSVEYIEEQKAAANTPIEQSVEANDRTITQKIRQAITSDSSLSADAKNIKIIVINGVVTLRGPIGNAAEQDSILKKVNEVRGVTKVNSQLVVPTHH